LRLKLPKSKIAKKKKVEIEEWEDDTDRPSSVEQITTSISPRPA
jgi:hypothetical protein